MSYYKKKEEHARINDKKPDNSIINGLFSIVRTGDLDKIKEFISKNNTVLTLQQDQNTVIHAILNEDIISKLKEDKIYILVKYFLENNVPIDALDQNNRTALHLASKYHLLKIVKLLIEHTANPNLQDDNGMLPIHYATIGFIKKCPDKKNIESIIKHDTTANLTNKSKKEIITLVYNYLGNYLPDVNTLSIHIKNTLKHTMLYDVNHQLDLMIDNFLNDIILQLSKETNKKSLTQSLNTFITNLYSDVYDCVTNKIHSKYFEKLHIGNNVGYITEDSFAIDGMYLILETRPTERLIQLYDENIISLNGNSQKLTKDLFTVGNSLSSIIKDSTNVFRNIELIRSIFDKFSQASVLNLDNIIIDNPANRVIIDRRQAYNLLITPVTPILPLHFGVNNDQDIIKPAHQLVNTDNVGAGLGLVEIYDEHKLEKLYNMLVPKYNNVVGGARIINEDYIKYLLDLDIRTFNPNTLLVPRVMFFSVIHSFAEYINLDIHNRINTIINDIIQCIDNIKNNVYNDINNPGNPNNSINLRYIYYNISKIVSYINRYYVRFIYICLKEVDRILNVELPKLNKFIDINISSVHKDIAMFGYDQIVLIFNKYLDRSESSIINTMISSVDEFTDTLNKLVDDINQISGNRYLNYILNITPNINPNIVNIPKIYDNIYPLITKISDVYYFWIDYKSVNLTDINKFYLKLIPSINKNDEQITYYEGGVVNNAHPENIPYIPLRRNNIDNHTCYNQNIPVPINPGLTIPNVPGPGVVIQPVNGKLYPINNIAQQYLDDIIVNPPQPPNIGLIGYNVGCYSLNKQNHPIRNIYTIINEYLGIIKYHIITLILGNINAIIIQNIKAHVVNGVACDLSNNVHLKDYLTTQPNDNHKTIIKILMELNSAHGQMDESILLKLMLSLITISIDNVMIINGQSILTKTVNTIIRTKLKDNYQDVGIFDVMGNQIQFDEVFNNIASNYEFELNLNKIFDTTDRRIIQNIPIGRFKYLREDNISIIDVHNENKFMIYDIDYNITDSKLVKTCYFNNLELIQYLLQHTNDLYHSDINNENPLVKSINTRCTDIIDVILQYYPLSRIIENEKNSPIGHLIDLYDEHLKYVTYNSNQMFSKYIENLTSPFTSIIKSKITKEEIYKNNMFKYYDNIYPLFMIIYNLMLFYHSRNDANISTNDFNNLTDLFIKDNIITIDKKSYQRLVPIFDIDDNTLTSILEKGIDTHVIFKEQSTINDEISRFEVELDQKQIELQKTNDIIQMLDPADQIDVRYHQTLQQKINNINVEIARLNTDIAVKRAELIIINRNMQTKVQNDLGLIRVNIQNFRLPPMPLPQNVPECVIRRFEQTSIEYHTCISRIFSDNKFCYNEIIKSYIQDSNRLSNLENIHLLMVMQQEKLLEKLKRIINEIRINSITVLTIELKNKLTKLLNEYQIIGKYYEVFKNIITSKDDKLYYFNKDDNPYLNEILEIVIHVIDNTIGEFFLNVIRKLLYTYFYTNSQTNTDTKLRRTIKGILQTSNINSIMSIERFLTSNELSRLFVKSVFNIQDDRNDDISNYTNPDKFVEILIGLLRDNVYHPFKETDIIIKYLKQDIYPFMKFIYLNILQFMTQFTKKYDSYIMNDYQYIKTTISFINKMLN